MKHQILISRIIIGNGAVTVEAHYKNSFITRSLPLIEYNPALTDKPKSAVEHQQVIIDLVTTLTESLVLEMINELSESVKEYFSEN